VGRGSRLRAHHRQRRGTSAAGNCHARTPRTSPSRRAGKGWVPCPRRAAAGGAHRTGHGQAAPEAPAKLRQPRGLVAAHAAARSGAPDGRRCLCAPGSPWTARWSVAGKEVRNLGKAMIRWGGPTSGSASGRPLDDRNHRIGLASATLLRTPASPPPGAGFRTWPRLGHVFQASQQALVILVMNKRHLRRIV